MVKVRKESRPDDCDECLAATKILKKGKGKRLLGSVLSVLMVTSMIPGIPAGPVTASAAGTDSPTASGPVTVRKTAEKVAGTEDEFDITLAIDKEETQTITSYEELISEYMTTAKFLYYNNPDYTNSDAVTGNILDTSVLAQSN